MIIVNKIQGFQRIYRDVKKNIPGCSPIKAIIDLRSESRKYHLMEEEYYSFDFYHKTRQERKEYVYDWEIMNVVCDTFNSKEECQYLDDKSKFDEKFKDYLGRDFLFVNQNNCEEFISFTHKHSDFMIKPLDLLGGKGIERKSVGEVNHAELVARYGTFLVEEVLSQNKKMSSLCSDTVNTIRVLTMRDKKGNIVVPFANIRIGRMGNVVDNFCHGGMTAAVDLDSGKVISPAYDKTNNIYNQHPDTGTSIVGFEIPFWNQVIETVISAFSMLPQMRYIGWDVAISGNDRVCLIEGNSNPEARLHQIGLGRGLKKDYINILGEW